MQKDKIVLALSGGMDSTTLLGHLINHNFEVYPVTFYYGSKHNQYEYESVKMIQKYYKIDNIPRINLDFVGELFKSNLLKSGGDIPEGHYTDETMSKTVVPNRNMIFSSILAGYAESIGARRIALGVHSGDHAIYADCRPIFIAKLEETIIESLDKSFHVFTPFLHLTKKDILEIGYTIDVPYHLTRTCYKDQLYSCGKCGSCNERLEAFELIGKKDPITYEKECCRIIEDINKLLIDNTNKYYSVSKTFKFDCSHRLNVDYTTPCINLHGHSYKVTVTIESYKLNKNDMVIDFNDLKGIKELIDHNLDHATLVYIKDEKLLKYVTDNKMKAYIFEKITTSENLAEFLLEKVKAIYFNKIENLKAIHISVHETENNFATISQNY